MIFVAASSVGPNSTGGVFRSNGDGAWQRLNSLPNDRVHAVTVHPDDHAVVYAGTEGGLYRSRDRGDRWERLAVSPEAGQVWALFVHPSDHQVLYAGTSPVGVWRSEDGGESWRQLHGALQPDRVKMEFPCRVMRFAGTAANPNALYAALEVGGVMRTTDGGETWEDCCSGLLGLAERPHLKSQIQSDTDAEGMLDAHAIAVSPADPDGVLLAVRMGLFRGKQAMDWVDMEVGRHSPLTYARDVRVSPQDPKVLYACLSPAARSHDGSVYRSPDLGKTWSRFDHGVKAEATMMALALHPQDSAQVHCVSRCGQVFSTTDTGNSWRETRLPDGVKDAYAIACA